MKPDLALTYKSRSLKNFPHRQRLGEILKLLVKEGIHKKNNPTYADIGCNDGYITGLIAKKFQLKTVCGYDHCDKLEDARQKYPEWHFSYIELNEPVDIGQYDLVTCFETLEHVGNPVVALNNLLRATRKGGTLLVTVPIEIGPRGILKFLVKTILYHYKIDDLRENGNKISYLKYLSSLLLYKNIGAFREERFGWGTHFGFDYRIIDRRLKSMDIDYKAKNKITTRFYLIKP